jgi:organic radical activating enzyme
MENKKIQPTWHYAKSFHQALGILVTMKCPLECAHCGIESSPRREEILDRELIVSRLREIGEQGKIQQLIITGGEPFAVRPLLHAILEVALEYDIYTYVQSSGFWASSRERAIATLTQLPRITHLGISADEYHESFVPLQYVKNALEAAIECDIRPELSLRVWDMENDPFLQHFYAEENYLLQAIRVWGPKRLAEIVIEHGMGDRLKDVYEKDSICLLCTDLLSQPEICDRYQCRMGNKL